MVRSTIVRALNRVRSEKDPDAGFTLVEVLVSFVILAIVSTAGTLAIVGGINTAHATTDRVTAANLAQQSIQQAQTMPRTSLLAAASATTTVSGYTVTRTVGYLPAGSTSCPATIATDAPHEITVHVAVTPSGANPHTVAMDTVIAC